nr:MAG TPA: ASCH domain protein [Caudoviricetes sp.]
MSTKPILFNTEMVRAILGGRKTCTRRLIKHNVDAMLNSPYHKEHPEVEDKQIISKLCLPPYQPGDVLYVRETWSEWTGGYVHKAWSSPFPQAGAYLGEKWHPSIHMPKDAARIWLKVTEVRVERLQDIDGKGCVKEGIEEEPLKDIGDEFVKGMFHDLWDSIIKKSDLDRYGWDANPWVWVIEFERCERPEALKLKDREEN